MGSQLLLGKCNLKFDFFQFISEYSEINRNANKLNGIKVKYP